MIIIISLFFSSLVLGNWILRGTVLAVQGVFDGLQDIYYLQRRRLTQTLYPSPRAGQLHDLSNWISTPLNWKIQYLLPIYAIGVCEYILHLHRRRRRRRIRTSPNPTLLLSNRQLFTQRATSPHAGAIVEV